MRRPAFVPAVLLLTTACALPTRAQDARDFDLAGILGQRGWFDLARELFERIENDSSLPKARRAEGSYGLAWLVTLQIDAEPKPEKKKELFDKATGAILGFINNPDFRDHPRRADALSVIGDLYQKQGRFYLAIGHGLDKEGSAAQQAFSNAQKLFNSLIEQLERDRVNPPDAGTLETDPKSVAFNDWNVKMMMAKYNFGISLFNEAEAYRSDIRKHPQMKKLLEDMNDFFEKRFMWDYEEYLQAYSAFTYMGRGFQMLAEASEAAKAEEYWKKCFNFIGKAISLMTDPKNRKSEAVRELALEAAVYTVRAKIAYGDGLRGGKANRQYDEAGRIAADLLKLLPQTALRESFAVQLRLEEGRALGKAR